MVCRVSKCMCLVFVTFVFTLVACTTHENAEVSGLGWIKINLQIVAEPDAPINENFELTLTDLEGGYSHTWEEVSLFPEYESFQVGTYLARVVSGTEFDEGYDCPCYIGETEFQVIEAHRTEVTVRGELSQSLWKINCSESFKKVFPDAEIVAHCAGFRYLNVDKDADKMLMLMPGETYFYVTIYDKEGREISLIPELKINTLPAVTYSLDIDFNDQNILTFVCGDQTSQIIVDDKLFETSIPIIETQGFISGETINLVEGFPSSKNLLMIAKAEAGLESVILTIYSDPTQVLSFEGEYDLMKNVEPLELMGLVVNHTEGQLSVNFTSFLENISIDQNTEVNFMVQARDVLHRVSDVTLLKADIVSMDIGIVSQESAVIGVNRAKILLQATSNLVEEHDIDVWETDAFGNPVKQLPLKDFSIDKSLSQINIGFDLEPGVNNVPVRIDYMGFPKIFTEIERFVPPFSIGVDPMATSALVMVNNESEEITQALLQYITVYANGEATSVSKRIPQKNMLWITGLEPSHSYTLTAVVIEGQEYATAKIVTESATPIPMGDFEDAEESITYKNLSCGGAYSSGPFPIYNMQNFEQINVWWPKKSWSSVNSKTFCTNAKNHNTWYMQPSSVIDYDEYVSGSKSICISTVGWSLDGEEISPYMQKEGEYIPYNDNVPYVEHRSAGKLFLGSYSFDANSCTERYSEGIPFSSRPSSLNGFFKYEPDKNHPDDQGIVVVELVNENGSESVTIAHATTEFGASPSFVAFNLPLEYNMISVRPTKLKIMFSSTVHYGDILLEDEDAPATPNAHDACYKGSSLWIDNLSFSY